MRIRWTNENTFHLYELFFPPLYSQSTLDYLELIHFEELYSQSYFNNYHTY